MLCFVIPLGNLGMRPDNSLPGWSPPVDPGYGRPVWGGRPDNSLPWAPVRPDNSLPGGPPVDPGYGRPGWSPVDPGYGRPGWSTGRPDNSLPPLPVYPSNALPGDNYVDNTLPGGSGGQIGTLPTNPPQYMVIWVPGFGYMLRPVNAPDAETKPVDPAEPK